MSKKSNNKAELKATFYSQTLLFVEKSKTAIEAGELKTSRSWRELAFATMDFAQRLEFEEVQREQLELQKEFHRKNNNETSSEDPPILPN